MTSRWLTIGLPLTGALLFGLWHLARVEAVVLFVPPNSGVPGADIFLPLVVTEGNDAVAGVQTRLNYPDRIVAIRACWLDSEIRGRGFELYQRDDPWGGPSRTLLVMGSLENLGAGREIFPRMPDGVVLWCWFNVRPDAAPGLSGPVTLTNSFATDTQGNLLSLRVEGGSVSVDRPTGGGPFAAPNPQVRAQARGRLLWRDCS